MNTLYSETWGLVKHQINVEKRSKATLGGLLLYVVSTIYVIYLSFKTVDSASTWNALFWIVMLFGATQAIAKSFVNEGHGRQVYLYTLASAQAVILSKLIFNTLLVVAITLLSFPVFILLVGNPVADTSMFVLAMILGSSGFAGTLTLVSAIAAKSNNNLTLMSILGFPIALPLLMTLMVFSIRAIQGVSWDDSSMYVVALASLNVLVWVLSYILFPYLWRE